MSRQRFKLAAIIGLPLALAGCTTTAEYSAKDAGFTAVEAKVSAGTAKRSVWIQNREQAAKAEAQVKALLARKSVDADTAIDENHCGACGMRCAGGMGCCDGACVDTQTDRDHCGAFCFNCAPGLECCVGNCADLNSFQHCGSCDRACETGEQCCAKQCTPGACPSQ